MDQIEGTDWNGRELAGAVAAYRKMQELDAAGTTYTKKSFYIDLEARFGRDAKAFERRMQNISAVLDDIGQPWLKGLVPARNVGARAATQLRKLLAPKGLPPYHAKLPAMRAWLIAVARSANTATYGALMAAFDLDRFNLRFALAALGHESARRGEPILTALVVNAVTNRCSPGLQREFGIEDDQAERLRLYGYWRNTPDVGTPDIEPAEDGSLEQRAARFARQEVRPEQAAFRKRVYVAYAGKCVISGCDIRRALDAAHIKGRKWRSGHNKASDGVLLRKDLHALYDAGLLEIGKDGSVSIAREAKAHYPLYCGSKIARPG